MCSILMRSIASFLCFLAIIHATNSEVFVSTAYLVSVFTTQREIVENIDTYINTYKEKNHNLQKFIDDYKQTLMLKDLDEVVSNPLSAFQLVKRLIVDWNRIKSFLNDHSWTALINQVQKHHQKLSTSRERELDGIAMAILRLQEMYLLNASDVARGNLLGIQTTTILHAKDCLYLANFCSYHGYLDCAFEWYDQALRVSVEESSSTVCPEEITPYLNEIIREHDLALKIGGTHGHIFPHPIGDHSPAEMKRLSSSPMTFTLGVGQSKVERRVNYRALCRGEQIRPAAVEASLSCFLAHRVHASFLINPIKIDVHNYDPLLVTFHDVIYESEINFLKDYSTPLLKHSLVSGFRPHISKMRTSMNAWLRDDSKIERLHEKLEVLMDRIARITGLNVMGTKNSEPLQVANYGIGGHYEPHYDHNFRKRTPEEWVNVGASDSVRPERLATFMFYLSDVSRGGATVFPAIGAAVWPRKGSAAFWYNVHKNGDPDYMTVHAACPVVLGSKWIANKWIRDVNQVFKRPCSRNPEE